MIKLSRPACPHPAALAANNYKHPRNKAALEHATAGKCMYCESKTTHVNFGDVEHILPKAIFPNLEFDWNNHGYVCDVCNNAKLNKHFAAAPFIDPFSEDPADHLLAYGSFLFPRGASARGEVTIREIALNRTPLIGRREERIKLLQKALMAAQRLPAGPVRGAAIAEIEKEGADNREFSMAVRAALAALK